MSAAIELEHVFRDGFAWSGELDLVSFDGALEDSGLTSDANGVGLSGQLRWYALRGDDWRLFLEFGLGLLATDGEFPAGGTPLNGTRKVGLGGAVDFGDRWSLILGIRQQHVSNGRGLVDENPSWEGTGAYIGLQYDLRPSGQTPVPTPIFEPIEPLPVSLRLEGRVGELGDASGGGGVLSLDGRLGGSLYGQVRASLDHIEGESLSEAGLALYLRGERGLVGLAYDRQEFDVFVDDEVSAFAEWYANDLTTVHGTLGSEARSAQADRVFGAVTLGFYPLDWLQLESGIVARDTLDDFGPDSFDVPLGLEALLPAPAGLAWSIFLAEDLHDESRVVGIRLMPGGAGSVSGLRDLHRQRGPLRNRP